MLKRANIQPEMAEFIFENGLAAAVAKDIRQDRRRHPVVYLGDDRDVAQPIKFKGAEFALATIHYVNGYNPDEELASREVQIIEPGERAHLRFLLAGRGNRLIDTHRGVGELVMTATLDSDNEVRQHVLKVSDGSHPKGVIREDDFYGIRAIADQPEALVTSALTIGDSSGYQSHSFGPLDEGPLVGGSIKAAPEYFRRLFV